MNIFPLYFSIYSFQGKGNKKIDNLWKDELLVSFDIIVLITCFTQLSNQLLNDSKLLFQWKPVNSVQKEFSISKIEKTKFMK